MAGEVSLRATLARPYALATGTPQVTYLLLEVQPGQSLAQVRMPVNVAFVLDRSGSMKGDKMRCVREATAAAVDMLGVEDLVSIVIFDHRSDVLLQAGHVRDKRDLKQRIANIRDAGGTRIAPAVEKGLKEIAKNSGAAIKRLVLLTDGQTEGEADCLRRADDAARLGVPMTALGIGQDWNEDLLIEMANRSGGSADYISRPEEIVNYFQTTVQRAQASAIQNAGLTLRLVQGATPRTVWQVIPLISNLGYKPVSDRDVHVPLGELESGQGRTLLIELLLDPRPAGQYRIGQVDVAYDVPALGLTQEKSKADILITFSSDQAQVSQVNPQVMNIVEKVSAFKLQTRALQDLQSGDVRGATQKLQSAVTRLLNQGEADLAATMQQEIDNLEKTGQLSSEGQKTIKFGTRKTVRLSDLSNE